MKNYICNLMIPGAAKSGTPSRHDLLGQHRDIDMSKPKEPQHFSFDDLYEGRAEAHNGPFRSDGTHRYHGESSQCYMFHPIAMRRIKQHLPSPKIILRLRDPVAQLWSQYQWNYRRAVERAPLIQALTKRGEDTGYNFNATIRMHKENGRYLSQSRYSNWVLLWRDTFGDDSVPVLRTEDLRAGTACVMARCFAFLDLAPVDIKDRPRRKVTNRTLRILPAPVARMEQSMPGFRRRSCLYQASRWRLLRALTPVPPAATSPEEKDCVHDSLPEHIAFYESLAI